jgi:hypothetical protein
LPKRFGVFVTLFWRVIYKFVVFKMGLRTGRCRPPGLSWKPSRPRRPWPAPANAALDKFLHTHKLYRPQTYEKRIERFAKATDFCASEALTQAKSRLALTRARQLRVLQAQLDDYRQQIEKLFARAPRP